MLFIYWFRALGPVVGRFVHIEEVVGPIPTAPTRT